jgi:hypothetical protein
MSAQRRRLAPAVVLTALCSITIAAQDSKPASGAAPPGASQSATSYLPADALVAIQIQDGDRSIARLRELLEDSPFYDGEGFRRLESNTQFMQSRIALAGLAVTAGTDPWNAVGALFGRDLALAILPGEPNKPRLLAAMVAREPALIDRLLSAVHALAGLVKNGEPDASRSREIAGVRVFSASPELHHCRVDDALLVSNSRELLTQALELRNDESKSLAGSPRFRAALAGAGRQAAIRAAVDLKALRALIPKDQPLDGPRENPLGGLLFGAWWHTLLKSDFAVAWLDSSDNGIKLEARVTAAEPLPASHRGFAPATASKLDWPAAKLPRFLSELRVFRDWPALFGEREALLTTPAASQLVNFSTTMSTLFGGMDFLNDVLPKLDAPARLILTRQDFSVRDVIPSPQLPAFALVVPLKAGTGADFVKKLGSASQMALTLVSLGAAQEGNPSYLIDVDRYNGVKIVYSEFTAPPPTDGMSMDAPRSESMKPQESADSAPAASSRPARVRGAAVQYNFLPAAAVVANQYVVATSREMLQDVIDAALAHAADSDTKSAAMSDSWIVDAASLATILRDNREELIVNRMLQENESKQAAAGTIDLILELLGYLDNMRVSSQTSGNESRATLEIRTTIGGKPRESRKER